MSQSKSELVRLVFRYSLKHFFQSDIRSMATTLEINEKDLERVLAKDSTRIAAPVFDKLVVYCLENGYRVDDVLAQYKDK